MSIRVANNNSKHVTVSINQWGTGGDTSRFTLEPQQEDFWDRTDPRGFIMSLAIEAESKSYIVFAGSNVEITETNVVINSKEFPLPVDANAQAEA